MIPLGFVPKKPRKQYLGMEIGLEIKKSGIKKGLEINLSPWYYLAPQHGLEPRTRWLTATCSAYWATGEDSSIKYKLPTICLNNSLGG